MNMVDWGKGYITDIEYIEGFYASMAPQNLALTAVFKGLEPPDLDGSFTYCELGCSRGLSSLIYAAVNPQAVFHAVDFNPASIAHARARARAARLDNVTFHERSFESLTDPSARLPMFDVIALHGVWSWITAEMQAAIVAFLKTHLKPGGLVYISYNALPAWIEMMPLQRVLRELVTAQPGRSDQATANAIATINHFANNKIIPSRFQDGIKRLNDDAARAPDMIYLAHEYLHTGWAPYYFADVARAMVEAKLSYVGSPQLIKNFWNLALNAEQLALLSDIASPELRETLRDFCVSNRFRRDVYVRGAREMNDARRQARLNALSFALVAPAPEVVEVIGPGGTAWRPDPAIHKPILRALESGPRRLDELLALPRVPSTQMPGAAEIVAMLTDSELAYVWRPPSRDAQDAAARLNAVLADAPSTQGATIAVPALGRGLLFSPSELALYKLLHRGETPDATTLALGLVGSFRAAGRHPMVDGKPVENETEAISVVTRECAAKITQNVPIWRMLGIVP